MLRRQWHRRSTQYRRTSFRNDFSIRTFCAQTKAQRSSESDFFESTSSGSESQERERAKYEDSVITLTPKQKLREWTRMYHQIESAKWVKHHLGIPFWALHLKYLKSQYLQRVWATRIMRREGHGEQWRDKSIVNPTEIRIADDPISIDDDDILKTSKSVQFDKADLDFLFYHKAPMGYMTTSDGDDLGSDEMKETKDEEAIIESLQFWFDTYSKRKYWESFDLQSGNVIFSEVKWREHRLRLDAAENGVRDEDTNFMKPKDATKRLNPYRIIPEENPQSEFIQFGGKYLSDFVDFKGERTRKMITFNDSETTPLLEEEGMNETNGLNSQNADGTFSEFAESANSKNVNSADSANNGLKAVEGTESSDYRLFEGFKFNRSLKWWNGLRSGQSLKENVADIESIEFPNKSEYDAVTEVIGKRGAVDMRTDLEKNKRFSGWQQLIALWPSAEELAIIWKLKRLNFVRAIKMVRDDWKFVMGRGGGEVLRRGYPPQLSLQEFTTQDQFECAMGHFGSDHTLFSDWFVATDNKREGGDASKGRAMIIGDRLVFRGFLHHSCIEMGHRVLQKSTFRDFVGFVNVISHDFEPELDLLPFWSIGIKLRSDGRPYLLGLECLNRNKLIVFQGIISVAPTPDGEWDFYEIPLHHFRPFDNGQFIEGEPWMKVRHVRSVAIQAMGATGPFHLEVQWIRAMAFEARFDVEDEDATFISDVDALGLYKEDLLKFHIVQHQYFIDDFPDPFRFEDNGVFDDAVYLGPPRSQREHFGKLPPELLSYIDVVDDIPLSIEAQKALHYYLDSDDMLMFENQQSLKLIGTTKAIQQMQFTVDSVAIADATNNLLFNQLKNKTIHRSDLKSGVYHNLNIHRVPDQVGGGIGGGGIGKREPFVFEDLQQTSNAPITILTRRRRELLRSAVPEHLRERVVGKWPHLI